MATEVKDLNITVHANDEGTAQKVILLQGEAESTFEQQPNVRVIEGQLDSILRYVDHQRPDTRTTHVLLNYEKLTAELFEDEKDYYADKVIGRIVINPELLKFQINKNKQWTREDLRQFLQQNSFYFPDPQKHAELLTAIMTFTAKVEQAIEEDQSQSGRGNTKSNYSKKVVNDSLPFNFIIEIPIFKGSAKTKVKVDICFDVTGNGKLILWFESQDLAEIIYQETEKEFAAIKARLDTEGILYFNA